MTTNCRICGNSDGNRVHRAREMMFATRDEFDYVECGVCGTIQLADIPDLAQYYPPEYYSFADASVGLSPGFKSRLAARLAAGYLIGGSGAAGKFLANRKKWIRDYFPAYLARPSLGLRFDSRVLDFGSGGGALLNLLSYFGFRNLTGADAFVEKDIVYPNGVRILKRPLGELDGPFDLIMLNHSFEHLPDPRETLREVHRLIADGGFAIVRIPVVNFAWEKYGVNWVQLDPPRHLFLFTERAFRKLADECGFELVDVLYDSVSFQFYGSEQYKRNIPMSDRRAFRGDFSESVFTEEEIREWEREAARLNEEGRGDQACFYLRRKQ